MIELDGGKMRHKRKRAFSYLAMLLLLGTCLFVPSVGAAGKNFIDFDQADFGFDSVSYLVDQEVIDGYPDGRFQPNKPVNRAETAVMFQRALELEASVSGVTFKDVPNDAYYMEAAAAAKEAGIFEGTGNGVFGPFDQLTREQMASVLVRAFDLKPVDSIGVQIADDDQILPVHLQNVTILYQNGVTEGIGNGKFNPKGSVTRAQFSVFLHRVLQEIDGFDNSEEQPETQPGTQPGGNTAPGGGGGSVGEVETKVTQSYVKTTEGLVTGDVDNSQDEIVITYNLSSEKNESKILSGSISVSEESTLTLTDFPVPDEFLGLGVGDEMDQKLQKGENSLAFAAKIGSISFTLIRGLLGNFDVKGTLEDHVGNSKDITINFIVE